MIENAGLLEKPNNGENTKNYENYVPSVNATTETTTTLDIANFDTALWCRIQAFKFDPPDAKLTFAIRLSRETGWTSAFAAQAIQEYRRFLYLAVRAGHPVTPSQEVDEVWHLHLMYTRHYWGVLCRDVLQTDLHHGPSLGGASEHAKYHGLYGRTLDSYARIFGAAPPAEFWPSPTQRFRPTPRVGTVDPATHWIIRKPTWPLWPKLNVRRGMVLFCLTMLALGAPPMASSWAASNGRHSENYLPAIILSLLGLYGLFKVIRFLTETPSERTARKDREARNRQYGDNNGGSMSSGGCGGDGGSGCGGGCGGGCS
jgi:uncharacterized membrane protein YgcG